MQSELLKYKSSRSQNVLAWKCLASGTDSKNDSTKMLALEVTYLGWIAWSVLDIQNATVTACVDHSFVHKQTRKVLQHVLWKKKTMWKFIFSVKKKPKTMWKYVFSVKKKNKQKRCWSQEQHKPGLVWWLKTIHSTVCHHPVKKSQVPGTGRILCYMRVVNFISFPAL